LGGKWQAKLFVKAVRSAYIRLSGFPSDPEGNILYPMATAEANSPSSILEEDGARMALAEFADAVDDAIAAIRKVVADAPADKEWTLRELREAAGEGRRSSAMTSALFKLEELGELTVNYLTSTVSSSQQ
jgi:hypothetical protein